MVGILNYIKQYTTELLYFAGGYADWIQDKHHAGFDISANRSLKEIKKYIDKLKREDKIKGEICFWITGHSKGAAVANLIAAALIDGNFYNLDGNEDNVYCYTFASPNTFYRVDNKSERENYVNKEKKVAGEYTEPRGVKYRCIFNTINKDDFVPKLPMEECMWTRYGRDAKVSVKEIKNSFYGSNLQNSYCEYLEKHYNTSVYLINSLIISFNSVYENKSSMRYDTYQFIKENGVKQSVKIEPERFKHIKNPVLFLIDSPLVTQPPFFARPYQKNIGGFGIIIMQYQMPAYFFHSITNALHEYVYKFDEDGVIIKEKEGLLSYENDLKFAFLTNFARWDFRISKAIMVATKLLNKMDYPHYLESYYSLTKEITNLDFK